MVERDLGTMQTAPVTQTELRRAKILLIRQLPLSEASTDSIAQGMLSRSQEDLPLNEPVKAPAEQYLHISSNRCKMMLPNGSGQKGLLK